MPTTKTVKFPIDKHQELVEWSKEVSEETGINSSLAESAIYAIKKLKEMRGTPSTKARAKGVITE